MVSSHLKNIKLMREKLEFFMLIATVLEPFLIVSEQ